MTTGKTNAFELTVEPHMTAASMKSGAVDVLATPILVAYMENVCMECVAGELEPGMTTVGASVNIRHLAATPVGMKVRFTCELTEIDRRRLVFRVEAFDQTEKIGEGVHERFVVDAAAFEAKAAAKK